MIFEEILNDKNIDYINHIVTPIAPYLICNHFISEEIHNKKQIGKFNKFINYNLKYKSNDLIKNKNLHTIKNGDIIQVQVDLFDLFYNNIIPYLKQNNLKIILFTSQWHIPQLFKNEKTDFCLNNNNILFWISQNPIYPNSEKYMAFPYGICHTSLNDYMYFLLKNTIYKNIKIFNGYSSCHDHLPFNHIRKQYDILGKKSGVKLNYNEYLKNISNAEFAISTSGDRDDCYRHYECIGLKTIPISDVNYKSIFDDNMISTNPNNMINMIMTKQVNYTYSEPNRDILTIKFWVNKINDKLSMINQVK
jgi:hypothetical protein